MYTTYIYPSLVSLGKHTVYSATREYDHTRDEKFQLGAGVEIAEQYDFRRAEFGGNAVAAFVAADGDYNALCPTRRLAMQAARKGVPVFLYLYSHLWAGDIASTAGWHVPPTWASHSSELPFVFNFTGQGLSDDSPHPFTQEEQLLSRAMRSYWASFARGDSVLNPLPPRLAEKRKNGIYFGFSESENSLDTTSTTTPYWSPLDENANAGHISLGTTIAMNPFGEFRNRTCCFWDAFF
jgi:carboxylesterase type B